MCTAFPGKIVLGIDARDGKVATQGWLDVSEMGALDLARTCANLPLAALVSGVNTIAVEIHQDSLFSSDISFDLELAATTAMAATATKLAVMSVQPPKTATQELFSQNLVEGLV
jgi:phosphoribosylformimino-5-aminoimidazole carboxamide ribonucleotide (ProFAR) isomerase